jgi:hypothetical protein
MMVKFWIVANSNSLVLMRQILILSLAVVTAGVFAADNEPPKLEPVPKPAAPLTISHGKCPSVFAVI